MRGRLLWKNAREIVPIWVTLMFAAVLCLSVTLWMVNSKIAHIAPLYISGHTFIALFSVITGVFLLTSENENRTVHLLRNLPLPPKQIIWQKLLLGGVGVIVFACCVAIITMLLASFAGCSPLESGSTYRFTFANVFLLPLFYLVVALVSSMITRSHFYGVLIAGAVCAGAIALLEPTWLGARESNLSDRNELRWFWVAMTTVAGGCTLVLGANGWVEEKAISKPKAESLRSTRAQIGIGTAAASPNPFPVLLWQSLRQSRTLLICCVGLLVIGWIAIMAWVDYGDKWIPGGPSISEAPLTKTMLTLTWTLAVMAMFASAIFLDDKRQGNYLFFQQNRERSKWLWLSRLLPFCTAALLVVAFWNFFVFGIGESFAPSDQYRYVSPRAALLRSSIGTQVASQAFLAPLLAMLGIIGIGQYFSMFVRNPILSFVFTGIISVIFVVLASYVVFVNESVWLFIVPAILAGYLATWWRSKFWLATSGDSRHYFLPIMLPVIVFAIVAASFIFHRATEFGDVSLDSTNFASWNNSALFDTRNSDGSNRLGLQTVEFGTEAQRKQAAILYREALQQYQGDYSLMNTTSPIRWKAKKTADFISKHKGAIEKIVQASLIPACAPFLSDDPESRGGQQWALKQMALVNSHHQLLKSNLSAAKRSIDAYDRVQQRTDQPLSTTRYETGYYGFLIACADHPKQELDALKSAIAIMEGSDSDIRPSKIVNSEGAQVDPDSDTGLFMARYRREFGGEHAVMNLQYEIASLKNDDQHNPIYGLKHNYRLVPWEYQRQLKVCQLRAIRNFNQHRQFGSIGNNHLVRFDSINRLFKSQNYWPPIPIDEDRLFPTYLSNYGTSNNFIADTLWRRYTLLRLGLAAYKIENGEYPEQLQQLEDYYEYGLPMTTDRLMFGWFKEGLDADLVEVVYKDVDAGIINSATKLANKGQPLLLPFYIDAVREMPEPIEYRKGKLGIDFDDLPDRRAAHYSRYGNFSYYRPRWNVGAE